MMTERGRIKPAIIAMLLLVSAGGYAQEKAAATSPNIDQRLTKMERLLNSKGLIDLLDQVESLQKQLQTLKGELDVQKHTLEQVSKRDRSLYADMDKRLQALESGQPAATAVAGAAATTAGTVAIPPPVQTIQPAAPVESSLPAVAPAESAGLTVDVQSPGAETEIVVVEEIAPGDPAREKSSYQEAFTLLKAGKYDESIVGFKTFLAQYPKSSYADNAQYWLGEAYYVKGQYEIAINEYGVLIQNYPESKKLTHAMLKIGYSYDELGMTDQARASLQDLIKRYPGTTAARLAEERLQRMALQQTP